MLYGNTDDGSSALWVCDEDGVVVNNISYAIGDRAPILEQINEHYGTSFTGWSDNEIGLRYGDPIPNWNAYEKIYGLYGDKIAINVGHGTEVVFAVGALGSGIFRVISKNGISLVVSENGQVRSLQGAPSSAVQYWQKMLSSYGLTASEVVSINTDYEVGQNINDWQSYTQYT